MAEKPECAEPERMDKLARAAEDVVDRAEEVADETRRVVAEGRRLREELKRSGDGKPYGNE